MHPSIANLSSRLHLCSGEVPPPLVGASATLVEPSQHVSTKGTYLYLFGGRLVSSRRMVNTLYRLDLEEMKWSKLTPPTDAANGVGSSSTAPLTPSVQPQPRYFHSADLWQDKIIFFGGMGYSNTLEEAALPKSHDAKPEELCVLDEILAFDLNTYMWDKSFDTSSTNAPAQSSSAAETPRPAPRYAHLSSLSGDVLAIIGGQNLANQYVESINIFDLVQRRWIGSQRFRKQCGSYRSLSVGAKYLFKDGEKANCYPRGRDPLNGAQVLPASEAGDAGMQSGSSQAQSDSVPSSSAKKLGRVEQNPLPMSVLPIPREPMPVYLYSNYNFTDVRRELEVLKVRSQRHGDDGPASADESNARRASTASAESVLDAEMPLTPSTSANPSSVGPFVSVEDRSHHMGGVTLPPGLRFPTGTLLGPFLIISGTYLANATQTFSIWALHLPTMVWSRIEAGSALSTGSWNRAILWPGKNRLVVVGHKERDLVSDYNHRQTNWDHVVVLELEAWGIYQPPVSPLSESAVQLGLDKLAATAPSAIASAQSLSQAPLEDAEETEIPGQATRNAAPVDDSMATPFEGLGGRGDFEIVCSDGLRIGCDRAILESRWPWFRLRMEEFRKRARRTLRIAAPGAADPYHLDIIPEDVADILEAEESDDAVDPVMTPPAHKDSPDHAKQKIKDPRFQPRHMQISEPSPVVLAFLQFVYSLRISTALQRHPAVVCALMILAKTYNMEDLATWARHAAHVALADDLNPKASAAGSRLSATISPPSSALNASDGNAGLELFRPAESLGLHPEERHRLAVCLYEAASLCGCEGLQIRALRVVMAIARWLQKHGAPPGTGGGAGAGPERAGNGRSGESYSRGSGGATAPLGGGGNGSSGGSNSTAPRNVSATTFHSVSTPSTVKSGTSLQMPSPALSMSRAGSETASSQGPLTPSSTFHSYLDHRSDSLSSVDGPYSGSSLAYLNNDANVNDSDADVTARISARHDAFSKSKAERMLGLSTQDVIPRYGSHMDPVVSAEMEDHQSDRFSLSRGGSMRKRFSLFGRNSASAQGSDTFESDPPRAGTSLGFENLSMDHETTASRTQDSGYSFTSLTSSPLTSPMTSEFGEQDKPHYLSLSRERGVAPSLRSLPPLPSTMEPKSRPLEQTSGAPSPALENTGVNGYGIRSQEASRSASQHSLSSSLSVEQVSLQRSASSASKHQSPAPTMGIEFSRDVSNLSPKEISKLEKEEKRRMEKEEKARKKAEKAEYKRLVAEAVFGPKGSAGPSTSTTSDFVAFTTAATAAPSSSRMSSNPSDSRSGSGASTASPRTASLRTTYSPRSPATSAPAKRGEWSVTTATTASPWFSAPPPPMYGTGLKVIPKSNRSVSSLSGKSSARSR